MIRIFAENLYDIKGKLKYDILCNGRDCDYHNNLKDILTYCLKNPSVNILFSRMYSLTFFQKIIDCIKENFEPKDIIKLKSMICVYIANLDETRENPKYGFNYPLYRFHIDEINSRMFNNIMNEIKNENMNVKFERIVLNYENFVEIEGSET